MGWVFGVILVIIGAAICPGVVAVIGSILLIMWGLSLMDI